MATSYLNINGFLCVFERGRESEGKRDKVYVCVSEREIDRWERERDRCVWEREREWGKERESVCVCVSEREMGERKRETRKKRDDFRASVKGGGQHAR